MALRLVDVYLRETRLDLDALDGAFALLARWEVDLADGGHLVRVLVETEGTEALLEWIEDHTGLTGEDRVVVTAVEATLPRPTTADDEAESEAEEPEKPPGTTGRISREELYQDVTDATDGTVVYYALVLLSTVVAAGGMLRDSVAVVIGAMVIAPLIGPNIALALGTTLGDPDLLRRALRVNVSGLLLGLGLAVALGFVLPVDPTVEQIASRTWARPDDVALALAAGVAGALAMTRGLSTALIGVMVAVALLPPLVAVGMLLGAGFLYPAYGAALLTLTNVAAINLAGVATFLAQGIRPARWYEAERARRATRRAVTLWLVVFALLVAAMLLADAPGL